MLNQVNNVLGEVVCPFFLLMRLKTRPTTLGTTQRVHATGFTVVRTAKRTIIRRIFATYTAPEDALGLWFTDSFGSGRFTDKIRGSSVLAEGMHGASVGPRISRSGAQHRGIGGATNRIVQESLNQHAQKVHVFGSRSVGAKTAVGQERIHFNHAQNRLVKPEVPTHGTTLFQRHALSTLPEVIVDVDLGSSIKVFLDNLRTRNCHEIILRTTVSPDTPTAFAMSC